MQIELIITFGATTSLTLTLILAKVLMMRHQFVLVIDTDQRVPRRQLLVESLLLRDAELGGLFRTADVSMLVIRAHLPVGALEWYALFEHGRVRLAIHRL